LQYEGTFGRIYGTIEEVENRTVAGAIEQLLLRHGYHPLGISNPRTGKRGKAWAEPGLIETSDFVPWEPGELEARQAEAKALEDAQRDQKEKSPAPKEEEPK
jgi:hypothetical protein